MVNQATTIKKNMLYLLREINFRLCEMGYSDFFREINFRLCEMRYSDFFSWNRLLQFCFAIFIFFFTWNQFRFCLWGIQYLRFYMKLLAAAEHIVEKWKDTLTIEMFQQIIPLVISLVKTLLSRKQKFCQDFMRVNICNHSVQNIFLQIFLREINSDFAYDRSILIQEFYVKWNHLLLL